jgi:hypothetical protein
MGAGADLTLKAVLETVLDAKGFDDFKSGVEKAAGDAKRAGDSAEQSGGNFDKLGRRLPHAAFDILSREMLRNSGVQQGLGPLTRVSTAALESLAAAGGLTTGALAGITFGLSLLLPLIALLTTRNSEAADATAEVKDDTDSLVETYEKLIQKGAVLTRAQSDYLKVLKELQFEERRRAEETIQAEIREQDRLIKSTLGLWSATKIVTKSYFEYWTQGKAFLGLSDELAQRTDKLREKQQQLGAQLENLREAHKAGFKDAGERARVELDRAEKSEARGKRAAEDEKKRAEFRLALNEKVEQEIAALRVDNAKTTFEKIKAIQAQEDLLLANEVRRAKLAGANAEDVENLKLVSHIRTVSRTRAEDKKYDEDRKKAIQSGIDKNQQEAEAVVRNITKERELRTAAAREEQQQRIAQAEQISQVGSTLVAAAETAFGKSKATAIAQAIINTYEGATKAAAQGGIFGPILAAAVIAFGIAQVNKIRQSTPQAGFDDPVNDAVVAQAFRNFGRKWAEDMTGIATASAGGGFREGLRGGRPGTLINQTTKIDRGTHVENANFYGMGGSPGQALLDLGRKQIRVGRVEDRSRRRA